MLRIIQIIRNVFLVCRYDRSTAEELFLMLGFLLRGHFARILFSERIELLLRLGVFLHSKADILFQIHFLLLFLVKLFIHSRVRLTGFS